VDRKRGRCYAHSHQISAQALSSRHLTQRAASAALFLSEYLPMSIRTRTLALMALLALAAACYWPGLSGPWLFDDF
jgi:hypothetical protein